MKSPYAEYPNIDAMSISRRTRELQATCMDALSAGLHPERIKQLIDGTIKDEQYEMAQAITDATEEFQKNPQLSLFLFDVPDSMKERPE